MYVKGRSVWVSGSYLESIFGESLKIEQIFIHGQRTEDSLIAVVVPNNDYIQSLSQSKKVSCYNNQLNEPLMMC